MKSICRCAYAVVLFLSALNSAPSLAYAQDAAGSFTLAHEVHWQNATVPAGEYRFTLATQGPAEMLTLNKISGTAAGFMLLVTNTDESKPTDMSRLVIVSRSSGSFVSAMQLPEFGITMHFPVPAEMRELAQSAAIPAVSTTR
jgi:hypothetical protein